MREIFASFVRKDLSARTTDSLNNVSRKTVSLPILTMMIREMNKSLMKIVLISF